MDIPALSMALAQNKTLNDVGVAVLAKSLDNMESTGAAIVDSIEAIPETAVNPAVGSNFDIRV